MTFPRKCEEKALITLSEKLRYNSCTRLIENDFKLQGCQAMDVFHCHDLLIPDFIMQTLTPGFSTVSTLMTVTNIRYEQTTVLKQ